MDNNTQTPVTPVSDQAVVPPVSQEPSQPVAPFQNPVVPTSESPVVPPAESTPPLEPVEPAIPSPAVSNEEDPVQAPAEPFSTPEPVTPQSAVSEAPAPSPFEESVQPVSSENSTPAVPQSNPDSTQSSQ